MMTIKLQMQGLHCASCADKIEQRVSNLPHVTDTSLSFATNELRFTMHNAAAFDTPAQAEQIIRDAEKGVRIIGVTVVDETEEEKRFSSTKAAVAMLSGAAAEDKASSSNNAHTHHPPHSSNAKGLVLLIAAASLFALSLLPGLPAILSVLLPVAAIVLSGYPIFIEGSKKLLRAEIEEDLLMMIAVIAACALGEFFEGAMVTLLFRTGTYLEDIAVARSKKSITRLTSIRPDTANIIDGTGETKTISADSVPIGSTILIKPGERVPLDATVLTGSSDMDHSVITGESVPVPVSQGDAVLSGTVNGAGLLTCKTTGDYKTSTASRIIELVESSLAKKGKTERLITRFARYYTPVVIVFAILIAALPPLFELGSFSTWLYRSLIFLVASCPCALVISVPLGFFAGIGSVSRLGVLVKGGRYLEALARCDAVVFDKTGTLTSGKLRVSNVVSVSDASEGEIVRLAAICESFSNHPVAKAVVEHYGVPVSKASVFSFEEKAGMGIRATHLSSELLCGSARLMQQYNVPLDGIPSAAVYVAENGILLGYLEIADTLRTDAAHTVSALRGAGVSHVSILTGDSERAAQLVASASGTDGYHASLLPAGKVDALMDAKKSYKTVAFVGDGINDAPVLAAADVGIAMGLGSDAAIDAADAVLVSENLRSLPAAIRLSRRVMRVIVFNIAFALAVKAAVLILGVTGFGAMWHAVFADVGVTLIAVLNTTRILRMYRKEQHDDIPIVQTTAAA